MPHVKLPKEGDSRDHAAFHDVAESLQPLYAICPVALNTAQLRTALVAYSCQVYVHFPQKVDKWNGAVQKNLKHCTSYTNLHVQERIEVSQQEWCWYYGDSSCKPMNRKWGPGDTPTYIGFMWPHFSTHRLQQGTQHGYYFFLFSSARVYENTLGKEVTCWDKILTYPSIVLMCTCTLHSCATAHKWEWALQCTLISSQAPLGSTDKENSCLKGQQKGHMPNG